MEHLNQELAEIIVDLRLDQRWFSAKQFSVIGDDVENFGWIEFEIFWSFVGNQRRLIRNIWKDIKISWLI